MNYFATIAEKMIHRIWALIVFVVVSSIRKVLVVHSFVLVTQQQRQLPTRQAFRTNNNQSKCTSNVKTISSSTDSTTRLKIGDSSSVSNIMDMYEFCLSHYQLPTVSITSAFCAGVGDAMAQVRAQTTSTQASPLMNTITTMDKKRISIFVLKGAVGGIIWSAWYSWLDPLTSILATDILNMDQQLHSTATTIPTTKSSLLSIESILSLINPSLIAAVLSTAMEQFFFCPLLFGLWDLPFSMLCRGDPIRTIPTNVQKTIGPVLLENAKVWTFANMVVYTTPLQWRVALTSLAEAVWQTILAEQLANAKVTAESPPPLSMLVPSSAASQRIPLEHNPVGLTQDMLRRLEPANASE